MIGKETVQTGKQADGLLGRQVRRILRNEREYVF